MITKEEIIKFLDPFPNKIEIKVEVVSMPHSNIYVENKPIQKVEYCESKESKNNGGVIVLKLPNY